jgi:hypothetical protein
MSLPPTTLLAADIDPFPCLDSLWNIYSKKGVKTVFISIGASASCLSDLEIGETLGCPINIAPMNEEQLEKWSEVKDALASRKRVNPKFDFSAGAEEKWIVPKNFNIISQPTVLRFGPRTSEPLFDWVKEVCGKMNVADTRIDILKIDVGNGDERLILMAMLDAGFRPSSIMVNWSYMPNTCVPTTLIAGHLQNAGYQLIRIHGTKFLYHFIDRDWYMLCDWETTISPNPLISEVLKMVPRVREANGHAKRLPPTGETGATNSSEEAVHQS